jgi:polysaccharide export outer membrane protein
MMTRLILALILTLAFWSAARAQASGSDKAVTSAPTANTAGSASASNSAAPNGFQERFPRYNIGLGDSFDIKFEFSPQFDQSLTVQPDGFISLKGIGDVHVAGKTMPQTTEAIRHAYSKILKDPSTVSVVLKDFDKPYFIADGQVQRPGKYDLRGDLTVTEAIAMAGGMQSTAKHSQVVLYRRVSDQWMHGELLDIKHMHAEHDLHEDLHLRSGDMIFVPKNAISKIQPWLPIPRMSLSPQTF